MSKSEPDRKIIWDCFTVEKVNPQGKFFDNVSRFVLSSKSGTELTIDINTEIYPVEARQKYICQVIKRMKDRQVYSPDDLEAISHEDYNEFSFIMSGVVFRMDLKEDSNELTVYASFGGLMMKLRGEIAQLESFKVEGLESRILFMMQLTS
jgi:DNA-directed RNA polymerase I, II, and III subunit RPABC3